MPHKKHNLLPEIKNRYSAQFYDETRLIESEKLQAVLEAARLAPSAKNSQPWRYIIAQSKNLREKLVKQGLKPANFWAKSAPVLIIQVSKPELGYSQDGKDYYLYDCGLSVMSLVIEAEHQGLKCRQIAGFNQKRVRQILKIPNNWQVIIIIAIGYGGNLDREKPNLLNRWGIEAFSRIKNRLLRSGRRKEIKEIVKEGKFSFNIS
jgi:nitroreductase